MESQSTINGDPNLSHCNGGDMSCCEHGQSSKVQEKTISANNYNGINTNITLEDPDSSSPSGIIKDSVDMSTTVCNGTSSSSITTTDETDESNANDIDMTKLQLNPIEHINIDFGDYPLRIEKDEKLGRYLVAKRDVKCGEIILKDEPIFMSPNAGGDDGHTCLGCCVRIKALEVQKCTRCGWPVCGVRCENNPQHKDNECEIFCKNGIKPEMPSPYCFIAGAEFIKVLRGLRLSSSPSLEHQRHWKLLQTLESHIETRKSIPKILFMSTLAKNFTQQLCKLEYEDETIDFILGVIDVNAFRHTVHPNTSLGGIRTDTGRGSQDVDRNATFLYPKAAMAAHGCRRNVRWETVSCGRLEMWAAEDIPKGSLLTHPYVDLMQGTPDRRRQLKDQFYFDCSCSRCSDPTELNTFFSALKCPDCKPGYLLPMDPLDYETSWKCNDKGGLCQCIKSSEYERDLVKQMQSEEKTVLEMLTFGSNLAVIGGLARILGKYQGRKVHQNHFVIVDVEYNLVKRMAKVSKPTVDVLHEMRRMIHKFLDLSNVFYPGITK